MNAYSKSLMVRLRTLADLRRIEGDEEQAALIDEAAMAVQSTNPSEIPEGCTVADARVLRAANHEMAETLHKLRTNTYAGMTPAEHVQAAIDWLDTRRSRLHHDGCLANAPDARCNCGLHKTLNNLRAACRAIE